MPMLAYANSSSAASEHDDHQAWLRRERELHAALMAKAMDASLPAAPMAWVHEEVAVPSGFGGFEVPSGGFGGFGSEVDEHFADIALHDHDFDAPVYRSLGAIMGADAAGLELAEEAESPVYRSIGGLPGGNEPMTLLDAERVWLDTMARPPLICRQKAVAAPFAIP